MYTYICINMWVCVCIYAFCGKMVKPFSQIFQAVCDLEEEKNQYISKVSPGLGLAGVLLWGSRVWSSALSVTGTGSAVLKWWLQGTE